MKRIIILLFLETCMRVAGAQHLEPSVIASSGAYYSNGAYTLSETVAEMASVTTLLGPANILTQGFQQPDIILTGALQIPEDGWQVKAYPNPTCALTLISLTTVQTTEARLSLTNSLGQVQLKNITIDPRYPFPLDLTTYSPGIYLVTICSGNMQKTFRIIRTN